MNTRQRVLIVEDDTDLRRVYRQALSMAGYEVQEARSGFEALRTLDSNPTDIVVLDLSLPGVDGFMVRHELSAHAHTRKIPVVVVTGVTQGLEGLEVNCLLRNPVTPEDLVGVVRKCLTAGATSTGA